MSNPPKRRVITAKERKTIWAMWKQNLKDWVWYHREHPDWFDFDIQGAVCRCIIFPIRNLCRHMKELIRDREESRLPETESKIGQLFLFAHGSLPRIGCTIRERLDLRRKHSIHSDDRRRAFYDGMHMHPAVFLTGALAIALAAVMLSLYTLGTSATYNGVTLGTVSTAGEVEQAVARVEAIARDALADETFSIDPELLNMETSMVLRTDIQSADVLEETLTDELGVVEYGYSLYVNGELIAATTYPGALEELLDQLKAGYHTPSTVECNFTEDVEVLEGFVDASYLTNLGNIAEILNGTKKGAVTYTVKSGDTLYEIAGENNMSVSDLRALNPGYSAKGLHPGDVLVISNAVPYLTVLNVERQNYIQNVPYSIEYQDDDTMYQGDYKVLSPGVYGKADVTANVTYVNGQETARQIVASALISDPIAELQARGTMPRPTWFPTGSFRWPCSGVITDYFGYRDAPTAGASSYHNAIDIGNRTGTPIYAADGGIVTFAGWQSGYGYLVKIDHTNGFVSYYAHCSALYVSVGDKVYKGEHIAALGNTGISTGPHLHFGLLKNGTWVNPLNYLP